MGVVEQTLRKNQPILANFNENCIKVKKGMVDEGGGALRPKIH